MSPWLTESDSTRVRGFSRNEGRPFENTPFPNIFSMGAEAIKLYGYIELYHGYKRLENEVGRDNICCEKSTVKLSKKICVSDVISVFQLRVFSLYLGDIMSNDGQCYCVAILEKLCRQLTDAEDFQFECAFAEKCWKFA
jgi:hypothetical protein